MLETVISRAHANAMSACKDFPAGLAYDECYTWAIAEFVIRSQIAEERLVFLIILAFVTAIPLVINILRKTLVCTSQASN